MTSINQDANPNIVHADPAKGFFVSMLIKDITLRDAIGDLVDNAVDAIKQRASDTTNLAGYEIEIKLNEKEFSIVDNGFGMEAEVARKTAFNFGKSSEHKLIDKSIGQFGIGMKRAFFKLGRDIHVKSTSATSSFELIIDVDEWLKEPKKWEFEFKEGTLKENMTNSPETTGVQVIITKLSSDSKISFSDKNFIDQLQKEIASEHMFNINNGLKISIDGLQLQSSQIKLVNDSNIRPTYWEQISENQSVRILAGISDYDPEEGGWYIFCNERLILPHNQQSETGWGDGFAKYHSQYYRFRGYVFFDAKDSSDLPWNTTKTGMDLDSPYYKEVKGKMIDMTLQVFDLLNKLKEEKSEGNPEENQTLNKSVQESLKNATAVTKVLENTSILNNSFSYKAELFNPVKKSKSANITYKVSNEKFEAVKEHIGGANNSDVGLKTFNYYYDNEL